MLQVLRHQRLLKSTSDCPRLPCWSELTRPSGGLHLIFWELLLYYTSVYQPFHALGILYGKYDESVLGPFFQTARCAILPNGVEAERQLLKRRSVTESAGSTTFVRDHSLSALAEYFKANFSQSHTFELTQILQRLVIRLKCKLQSTSIKRTLKTAAWMSPTCLGHSATRRHGTDY